MFSNAIFMKQSSINGLIHLFWHKWMKLQQLSGVDYNLDLNSVSFPKIQDHLDLNWRSAVKCSTSELLHASI